jgi:RHS repeat-associated protein
VSFGYDALGRRVRKTFRGQSTKWVWDGNVPLHEWVEGKLEPLQQDADAPPFAWLSDPVIKKREAELEALLAQGPPERGSKQSPITWLFEPESFAPMAKLVSGQQLSILTDHLGTPVLMTDEQGRAVWSTQYSVYGAPRSLKGARQACPFRWPGQYEDLETGLYYNRFRYYDAETGTYVSQDPIGLAGGFAFYAYVVDPLAWTDAAGLNGTPTLPERVLLENGNTRIIHNYGDLAREHAEPIHFHVEENGKQIAKIKADGKVIEGKLNKNATNMIEQKGAKNRLRRAEKKIARHIRASGGTAGGKPFRPGVRGGGCGQR